ncbi:hypothetical protein VPH35_130925 [Triticum aestivum]
MFLFFICSSFSYVLVAHVLPFVFIVFTDHYVSLIVGMAASQPNKPTMKEDGKDEMAGWWEKAAKKLRDEDEAALKKKKEEELEKERKETERATRDMWSRDQALVSQCEEAQKKRQKDFEERTMKRWAFAAEKEERKNKIFMERVVKEAHLIRKTEQEEEERKKKKGKGPCSTQ